MTDDTYHPVVLYEDNHLLVLAKPAGMLTQGDRSGDQALTDWSRAYLRDKYNKPGEAFVGLVHRLDRPTSGVVVLARTSKAARRLAAAFRERQVSKCYLAVAEAPLPASSDRLAGWLRPGRGRSSSRMVDGPIRRAQHAELTYRLLGERDRMWWYEVRPVTGRKHQIRAQLAAAGAPIVGDKRYGARRDAPARLLLHAWALTVPHPIGAQPMTWRAPVPERWPAPPPEFSGDGANSVR